MHPLHQNHLYFSRRMEPITNQALTTEEKEEADDDDTVVGFSMEDAAVTPEVPKEVKTSIFFFFR